MDLLIYALDTFQLAFWIVLSYWWIWAPVMLLLILLANLESLNRAKYLANLKWVMLEFKVPRTTRHSPKAMEQIFLALHSMPGMPKVPKSVGDRYKAWKDRFLNGKVPEWFSLEILGTGGEIHFYIRILEQYRNLVESQIYAYYPESEITEVIDYMSSLPTSMPNEEFDVAGAEVGLVKEDTYPILTYESFEEAKGNKDDAVRIDPLAPLAEALSVLNIGEYLGIQFLLRSADDSWVKKGQAVLDKIFDKPKPTVVNPVEGALNTFEAGVKSAFGNVPAEKKEEKKEGKSFGQLNPGMQDVVKAIEQSFSKLGFQTGIRIFYTARRDRFNGSGRIGMVFGALKGFSSQALNGFKSDS
ncbi:MAG: hypothetical protein AAB638_02295, partial [Patescibacteria group bacterium]